MFWRNDVVSCKRRCCIRFNLFSQHLIFSIDNSVRKSLVLAYKYINPLGLVPSDSYPERWRDRPFETSATTIQAWCQIRQQTLEDERIKSIERNRPLVLRQVGDFVLFVWQQHDDVFTLLVLQRRHRRTHLALTLWWDVRL